MQSVLFSSKKSTYFRTGPGHGQKYTKYKISLSTMMFMCIKQHLSNIWISINGKVKQH